MQVHLRELLPAVAAEVLLPCSRLAPLCGQRHGVVEVLPDVGVQRIVQFSAGVNLLEELLRVRLAVWRASRVNSVVSRGGMRCSIGSVIIVVVWSWCASSHVHWFSRGSGSLLMRWSVGIVRQPRQHLVEPGVEGVVVRLGVRRVVVQVPFPCTPHREGRVAALEHPLHEQRHGVLECLVRGADGAEPLELSHGDA